MLADYIKEFNNAPTSQKRIETFEAIWEHQLNALCKTIENVPEQSENKQLMMDVRDYYGDYDILKKVKESLLTQIKEERLTYFSNFEPYFSRTCQYQMTHYFAKLKAFKDFQGKFYYYGTLHDDIDILDLPLPEEIPPHDCINSIYNVFREMYGKLDAAKWGEAHKQVESYQARLKYSKCTPEERRLLQALLFHFQGHLYMRATQFKRAQTYLTDAIQLFKGLKGVDHFMAASQRLLAINLSATGKREEGFQLLGSLRALADKKPDNLELQYINAQCIATVARHTASFNPSKGKKIITNIPENIDFPSKIETLIYQKLARIHLYDRNPEEALKTLDIMEDCIKESPGEQTGYECLRLYSTRAEALLYNFQTRDKANLDQARSYLLKAKKYNALLKSKLWECIFNIIEGYIDDHSQMIRNGIYGLRTVNMQPEYYWYRGRFK